VARSVFAQRRRHRWRLASRPKIGTRIGRYNGGCPACEVAAVRASTDRRPSRSAVTVVVGALVPTLAAGASARGAVLRLRRHLCLSGSVPAISSLPKIGSPRRYSRCGDAVPVSSEATTPANPMRQGSIETICRHPRRYETGTAAASAGERATDDDMVGEHRRVGDRGVERVLSKRSKVDETLLLDRSRSLAARPTSAGGERGHRGAAAWRSRVRDIG
jgi:hypothetical protein